MDEARRFLRLIVPGLLFLTEGLVLILFLRPGWTIWQIKSVPGDGSLSVVLGSLLASGGIGFFFSLIHHGVHWRLGGSLTDYRPLIDALVGSGILQTRSIFPDSPVQFAGNARQQAWIITSALWHERVTSNDVIKGADGRATSLWDLVHALGAARIATLFAPIAAFAVATVVSDISIDATAIVGFCIAVATAVSTFVVVHLGYLRTCRFAEDFVQQVLADALILERKDRPTPILTYVDPGA